MFYTAGQQLQYDVDCSVHKFCAAANTT